MIGIEYHADLKEVQGDAALRRLLGEHARAPFDRPAWWQGLEAECGLRPLIAVAREGDAMAVLPLRAGPGHFHALGNWYNFTVRPVLTNGAAPLLAALASDLLRTAWRITLAPVPDEESSATLLEAAFATAGWKVLREQCDVNHILPVGGRSYADYLASRPGQLRTTLKRKGGKVETPIYQQFDAQSWQDYETVYRSSWKPSEGSPAFLRRFAEAEGAAGRLRLGIARHEGAPVAAQLWTVENGIAYIHKLAHTEESKPLSPGTTLSAALFAQVIDLDRVELVDFGTGDDGYKRDWMEAVRPRYRLDMFNPRAPRAWPHLAKAALRRLAPGRSHG